MIVSPLRTPGPVGLALITVVVGRLTLLMVVPVPHQGQLPVPAGMLVPKVIKSPDFTPVPDTFDDSVTCELVVDIDETVVPDGIAPGVVVSRTVMRAGIWV